MTITKFMRTKTSTVTHRMKRKVNRTYVHHALESDRKNEENVRRTARALEIETKDAQLMDRMQVPQGVTTPTVIRSKGVIITEIITHPLWGVVKETTLGNHLLGVVVGITALGNHPRVAVVEITIIGHHPLVATSRQCLLPSRTIRRLNLRRNTCGFLTTR